MLSPLKIGTVLLQAGTFIPDSVCVQTEPFCPGWQAITNVNGDDLDRQIRDKGWNFFFMCDALQGTSWAGSGVAVRSAAIRVLRKTKATKLNGLEITGIHERRFLGFRHVVVTGHSRHVQKSMELQNIAERIHQASQPEQAQFPMQQALHLGRPCPKMSRPVILVKWRTLKWQPM